MVKPLLFHRHSDIRKYVMKRRRFRESSLQSGVAQCNRFI